ncbi:MAG TPA: RNA methyltransferase [Ignavibacteriaceae bacterium]|nr:RNA methyltransferase [Ignavibacteriaceae bacterium]
MRKLTHDEISENRSSLETLHKVKKLPVYVLLNSIRSSYNVGSIFRTSDAAMIEKLILCGYTPHPPITTNQDNSSNVISSESSSEKSDFTNRGTDSSPSEEGFGMTAQTGNKDVLKTALGSTQSVRWDYIKNPVDAVKDLKAKGIKICALELTENSKPYYTLTKNDFPLCLIVGNEITGVSQEVLDLCDYSIEIPQYGIKQSLNVAVAYGIAIFELRKVFDSLIDV